MGGNIYQDFTPEEISQMLERGKKAQVNERLKLVKKSSRELLEYRVERVCDEDNLPHAQASEVEKLESALIAVEGILTEKEIKPYLERVRGQPFTERLYVGR